jgi:hypothetical protein
LFPGLHSLPRRDAFQAALPDPALRLISVTLSLKPMCHGSTLTPQARASAVGVRLVSLRCRALHQDRIVTVVRASEAFGCGPASGRKPLDGFMWDIAELGVVCVTLCHG